MRFAGFLLPTILMVGCTRAHYRRSADLKVYPIVAERSHAAGNFADRLTLGPHPGSRLADPTDPDRPPAPPNDPGAAPYMHHPNGMKGAHRPKKHLPWIEPPGWEANLPWGPNGKVKLIAEQAFELALLHSREYQNALNNLYLSALALNLNRFEFSTRWFMTNATDFTSFGVSTPSETNTLASQSNIGSQRSLAAGGQLIVDEQTILSRIHRQWTNINQ